METYSPCNWLSYVDQKNEEIKKKFIWIVQVIWSVFVLVIVWVELGSVTSTA